MNEIQAAPTCERCGRAIDDRDSRRFGVMVDGALTAERRLCLACLDTVLATVTAVVRRLPAPDVGYRIIPRP